MPVNFNAKESDMARITVDRRLWLDDDGKLVEDGDPKAAFLWAGEGAEVDEAEAKQRGYKPKSKGKSAGKSKG